MRTLLHRTPRVAPLFLVGAVAWAHTGPLAAQTVPGAAFAVGDTLPSPQTESYGVRPGDQVTTDFFTAAGDRLDVITGTRIVDRDGNLFFPYVGTVNVSGMDAPAIRRKLAELYGGFYTDPVVDVTVQLRVNVTGAVLRPGSYLLSPSATIVDALGQAGGVGLEVAVVASQIAADPSRIRLIRDGTSTILDLRPNVADLTSLQRRVQSGDWIFVPPRQRSRLRDEIQFWGSVLSFVGSLAAVVVLIAR